MLIVTPQVDWRRDGLPSPSSLLGGGGGEREEVGQRRGGEGKSLMLLSFRSSLPFLAPLLRRWKRVTPSIIFIVVFYLLFLEIIKGRKDFSAGAG